MNSFTIVEPIQVKVFSRFLGLFEQIFAQFSGHDPFVYYPHQIERKFANNPQKSDEKVYLDRFMNHYFL